MISPDAAIIIAMLAAIGGGLAARLWWPTRIQADRPDQVLAIESDSDRLVTMLDLLPDPVVLLDSQGSLIHANLEAGHLYGESVRAIVRHPSVHIALSCLPEGDSTEVKLSVDVPVRRVVRASFRRLPLVPYGTGMVLVVLADRTEQDAVERIRADFVAYASHELRTPLAALTGFIETLRGPAADDPKAQQEFLAIMAAQAARMQRLIDRLLYLSRVQMLEHQKPRRQIDGGVILDRVAEEAGILARRGDVELVFMPHADMLWFRGDADQMVQVLINLIENAIKYAGAITTRECRIVVSVQAVPPGGSWPMQQGIVFSVNDNGVGIDARHLPRLTERFYRVEGTASRQTGTGLGLSIVKHIVDRHGGRLVFDSEVGGGTTCLVWVPRGEEIPTAPT